MVTVDFSITLLILPSKWVRSVRLHLSYSASHPPILNVDGDPLHLWMTCCPYVQRIKLPQEMDSDRRENDWMYFQDFLKVSMYGNWNLFLSVIWGISSTTILNGITLDAFIICAALSNISN